MNPEVYSCKNHGTKQSATESGDNHCLPNYLHITLRPSHPMRPQDSIASNDSRIREIHGLPKLAPSFGLQSQLAGLRKERNAMTPLCAAPDEIIGRILAHLTFRPYVKHSFFDIETLLPGNLWLSIMLVCSRIRAVAVSTPKLWSSSGLQVIHHGSPYAFSVLLVILAQSWQSIVKRARKLCH
jgi:hypothetical protein